MTFKTSKSTVNCQTKFPYCISHQFRTSFPQSIIQTSQPSQQDDRKISKKLTDRRLHILGLYKSTDSVLTTLFCIDFSYITPHFVTAFSHYFIHLVSEGKVKVPYFAYSNHKRQSFLIWISFISHIIRTFLCLLYFHANAAVAAG